MFQFLRAEDTSTTRINIYVVAGRSNIATMGKIPCAVVHCSTTLMNTYVAMIYFSKSLENIRRVVVVPVTIVDVIIAPLIP